MQERVRHGLGRSLAHCHHRSSQSGMTLAGSLERRCSNICSRDVSGLASRNSDRRPPFIIQSLRASRGSAVSAGGGAELSVGVSADAMMPVYLAEQYHFASTRKDWGRLLQSFW